MSRKIVVYTVLAIVLCLCTSAGAQDPPNLLIYKQRILSGLPNAFGYLDSEYNARFVDMTKAQDETINKIIVYYDSTKALTEFYALCHDRTGLTVGEIAILDSIPGYITKSNAIIAQRYIQSLYGGGGYTAFPHGLGYIYQETGEQQSYDALTDLRNESNFLTGTASVRETTAYAREIAYSIQVAIMAKALGIPIPDGMTDDELFTSYLGFALSYLNQWHTGVFYDVDAEYMSPFIMGLTITALIEYYEKIDQDSRIPPAIKLALDDLWNIMWHPDVTNPTPASLGDASDSYGSLAPEGAFWGWADWDTETGAYIINRDHAPSSPDVSATNNMIIGPSYAWYGNYANDETYIDRAVDIFDGAAFNLDLYTPSGQMWQGQKYTAEFLGWYRDFYDTPCSNTDIDQCQEQTACESAGGNWTGEWCQYPAVTVMSSLSVTESVSPGITATAVATTTDTSITITGTATPNGTSGSAIASVTCDGQTVTGTTSWSATVSLDVGSNTFVFTVTDAAGETSMASMTINRNVMPSGDTFTISGCIMQGVTIQ